MRLMLFCGVATAIMLTAIQAAAIEKGGCAQGDCLSCHNITVEEASRLLQGMVESVDQAGPSEVPGLFAVEVTSRGKKGLLYLDFSKRFLVSGTAYDIEKKENVTQKRLLAITRVDVSSIPIQNSLILGRPKARVRVFVFTDPQCPFCKKLHPELQEVVKRDPDVAFYIKLLPLVALHPDSYRIAHAIMCAGRVELLEASFAGEKVPDPTCPPDAVEGTMALARSLGIGSTPTMVLPDGRLAPGFKKADDILKLLKEAERKP